MGESSNRERSPSAATVGNQQYLTFQLAEEMFAVGIQQVREIIEYGNVTTVPMMPRFVRGVINLRGSVVPVIDLSARFGRGSSEIHRRTCVVIVEVEQEGAQQELGMIVDAVSEVLDIPQSEIEPAPAFGARIRADFISGMGKIEGRFVVLLDVDKVLAVDEMAALSELVEWDAGRD
ncbi:chemotaxis protein CheW [Stutzerimonas nitrititolerans]|uniref:chemotaxis protein CheW n=1 Tax=Stutzerimonas nitrititolerans TaxID=2482751 RepID=UPI000EBA4469|nr:chemotaxis protein CheW [Stutzerimonas nitrititolerans]HCL77286.1 chemotaxis protein CheW [Pseudomonas sp.]